MDILVGYSGFVGSNLHLQHAFTHAYNSQNIVDAFGTNPDLCVYAGVRAEMFLANTQPEADLAIIKNAIENIKQIRPKKLVLISSIAVYDTPIHVNERTVIDNEKSTAYGKNRRYLEEWVEGNFHEYTILRLPALYGENLKKNFLYDMIHISPALLKKEKFEELCQKDDFISDYYTLQENGFYKCTDAKAVKPYFESCGFSALNFTDSRSAYQFYNLNHLWEHIAVALARRIPLFNLATQPITAQEVYEAVFHQPFCNELTKPPFNYDMKTIYFENGYIYDKEQVLRDVVAFIREKAKE